MSHPSSGAPGVWMPVQFGRDCVDALDDRASMRRELSLLDEQLRVRGTRLALLEAGVAAARGALSRVVADLAEERERASAWYRSPWLWLSVGGALGSVPVATAFSLL